MKSNLSINQLVELEEEVAFMGSDWVKDESVKDGPVKGHRYNGDKPCINCNDQFWWGCSDAEDITEELMEVFNKAVDDCKGDLEAGASLYCCRQRKMRPQGAMYSYIDKELWHLFDSSGDERKVGMGNPYKPGDYSKPA